MDYIVAAANIRAFNYGLKGSEDPELFRKVLSTVIVPEFKPKSGVAVQVKDDEPVERKEDEEETVSDVAATLPSPSSLAGYRMIPAEFEKDDDTNHHIDVSSVTSIGKLVTHLILTISPKVHQCCFQSESDKLFDPAS